MNYKEMFLLLARYIFLVAISFSGLYIIYSVLSPATIFFSALLLKIVYSSVIWLPGTSTLLIEGNYISIISACVAGAAYFLLLVLNLATPMPLLNRVKSIAYLLLSFFVLNVLRIFLFAYFFISGFRFFDFAHKATWYVGSTVLVVALWYSSVIIFKISSIPIYSDAKKIYEDIKNPLENNIR